MTDSVSEAIRRRRSVRSFLSGDVSRERLESLLELAVQAPNHRMTQPWGFVVLGPGARRAYGEVKGRIRAAKVQDPEVAAALRRDTVKAMEGLPAAVAFTQRLLEDPAIREEDYATVYMGIQNFLIAAVADGLGTHVRTGRALEDPETRSALGVGAGERIVALVEVGEVREVPPERPRIPAAERTRWLP